MINVHIGSVTKNTQQMKAPSSEQYEHIAEAIKQHLATQVIKTDIFLGKTNIICATQILDSFDFTVVQAAILDGKTCAVSESFIEDEINKRLVIVNYQNPISTVNRIIKYTKKGYTITNEEIAKIFAAWSNIPANIQKKELDLVEKTAGTYYKKNNNINKYSPKQGILDKYKDNFIYDSAIVTSILNKNKESFSFDTVDSPNNKYIDDYTLSKNKL